MLIGKSKNSMDSKGRITIPVKWRADLTESVIVLIGFGKTDDERYLQVMSSKRFSEITEAVNKLHPTDLTFIRAKRYIFPNAEDCSPDKSGRILLPADLIEYARLSGEVSLLGTGDSVQIWNPQILEEVNAAYGFSDYSMDLQALAERERSKT